MFNFANLFRTSDYLASLLPKVLAESAILTRNVAQGLHATRFAGKGEDFWQFKEFRQGDNLASINWRKSATLNKLLVKENENETAKWFIFIMIEVILCILKV